MDNKENEQLNPRSPEQNTEQANPHQEQIPQATAASEPEQATSQQDVEIQNEKNTPISSHVEAATATISMTNDSSDHKQDKANERLEQAKMMSRQYLNYYGNAIKEPMQSLSRTDESHFQNALITMGIIAVLFPVFIVLTTVRIGFGISFFGMIIQPLIYTVLSLVAAVGAIYVFSKWYGRESNWKRITVKYGTLLVPVPLCLIIATLFGLIGVSARLTLFFFTLSMLFILIALNILLIRQQTSLSSTHTKFDPIYSIAIANIFVGFFLYGIASSAISALISSMFRTWIPF